MNEVEVFYPKSVPAWRDWLQVNHAVQQSVWLVLRSKSSALPTVTWREAVDQALCFGWIDSKKIKIDEHTTHQFFSKRRPQGTWSKINKEKVKELIDSGLMTASGLEVIELAKQNGSWTILDEVEALIIPADLESGFAQHKGSKDYFLSLRKSLKKMMLYWVSSAKKPETRQKRIDEIVLSAVQKKKPKQF